MTKVIHSTKVQINASKERVWEILINLDQYPLWNPFTTQVTGTLKIGKLITMNVRMNSKKEIASKANLRKIVPDQLICWGTQIISPIILDAERYQILEPLDADHTVYYTYEKINGALSPIITLMYAGDIERGYNEMANALKKRAEH